MDPELYYARSLCLNINFVGTFDVILLKKTFFPKLKEIKKFLEKSIFIKINKNVK